MLQQHVHQHWRAGIPALDRKQQIGFAPAPIVADEAAGQMRQRRPTHRAGDRLGQVRAQQAGGVPRI